MRPALIRTPGDLRAHYRKYSLLPSAGACALKQRTEMSQCRARPGNVALQNSETNQGSFSNAPVDGTGGHVWGKPHISFIDRDGNNLRAGKIHLHQPAQNNVPLALHFSADKSRSPGGAG